MGCAVSIPKSKSGYGAGAGNSNPLWAANLKEYQEQAEAVKNEALDVAKGLLLAHAGKSFDDTYVRSQLVSYGASCRVFTSVNKFTEEKVAVKRIAKKPHCSNQAYRVLKEIAIMKCIEDHPNAVKLHAVFEDAKNYHLVMDYCTGGELFEHIAQRKDALTERQAAQILRSLMNFLAHMHNKCVAHMDIKPENLVFDSDGANGVLKVVDFGSAEFVHPEDEVDHAFGTVRYSSPEMASDRCGSKTDIWSAGVVMYLMLSGKPPFLRRHDTDTLEMIRKKPQVRFPGAKWRKISKEARECISGMLHPEASMRLSALEVLQSTWLAQESPVPDTAISNTIIKHLRTFAGLSRTKRLVLGVCAKNISGSEANRLIQQFLSLDMDFSGTVDFEELALMAKQVNPELSDEELRLMFHALDQDNSRTVDVTEFFASMMASIHPSVQDSVIERSFRLMDRAGSGYLTKDDLKAHLLKARSLGSNAEDLSDELDAEIEAMDLNGDGVVTSEEFRAAIASPSGGNVQQPHSAVVVH